MIIKVLTFVQTYGVYPVRQQGNLLSSVKTFEIVIYF